MEKKLTDEEWFDEYAKRCKDYEDGYFEQLAFGGTSDAQAEKEIEFDRRLIAYVHRLQEENRSKTDKLYELCNNDHDKLIKIREQKAEIERLENFIDFKTANVMCDKCKEQAVKDTAKEILQEIFSVCKNAKEKLDYMYGNMKTSYGEGYKNSVSHFTEHILKIAREKGVEVE